MTAWTAAARGGVDVGVARLEGRAQQGLQELQEQQKGGGAGMGMGMVMGMVMVMVMVVVMVVEGRRCKAQRVAKTGGPSRSWSQTWSRRLGARRVRQGQEHQHWGHEHALPPPTLAASWREKACVVRVLLTREHCVAFWTGAACI